MMNDAILLLIKLARRKKVQIKKTKIRSSYKVKGPAFLPTLNTY
jgi:hypothetical protein